MKKINSALCIEVTTIYDSAGNIAEQEVIDMTTRNALWSFSSHFKAKYNENNLLTEKEYFIVDRFPGLFTNTNYNATNSNKETYEYTFDAYNNWVNMKVFRNNVLTKVIKRKIEYYYF